MKTKRGFTLIEALLALALLTVTAGLMYTFFFQGFTLYTSETKTAAEQASLRQVLSDITNRVRLTDKDDIRYTDGVLCIQDARYTYDSAEHRVQRGDSILADNIAAFRVTLSDDLLEIRIESTSGTVMTTSLSLVDSGG